MRKFYLYLPGIIFMTVACHSKETTPEEPAPSEAQTPVTVTAIETVPLEDYVKLNATSSFLQSNVIKATTNGYIKSVNLRLGQLVGAGKSAFTLKTKEAEALGNTINKLDTSFRFSGLLNIKTTTGGYVQQLNHQAGDYVQDGEQLAMMSDSKSFGFVLNLPYELRRYVMTNSTLDIVLPDDTHLKGTVTRFLRDIDSASQTQSVLIRVNAKTPIPQNLIVKVRIKKMAKNDAPSLPKEAVLSDEAQTNFWIMKLLDSTTAVKVPIIKGVETGDRIEIVRPQFAAADKIVLSGNYGLPDTAKVKIVKRAE